MIKFLLQQIQVDDLYVTVVFVCTTGKDLSKISMPVTLNEPLSALQRLCEELEYSELLDEAASHDNIYDRMVRSKYSNTSILPLHHHDVIQVKVAAFAVSSFALNFHRAGRKPFNPILGETYECVREDKGFKFIAEQVSTCYRKISPLLLSSSLPPSCR